MRRGKDDPLAVRREKAAGRATVPGRYERRGRRIIKPHAENLIAAEILTGGLEYELRAVRSPIGLGVLAAERQLTDVGQPRFARIVKDAGRLRQSLCTTHDRAERRERDSRH